MQIDRWPTHIEQDHEDSTGEPPRNPIRPRASLLNPYGLKEQRVIPNPHTPIPARASAHPATHHVRRTAKLAIEDDVTQTPTVPPTSSVWEEGFVVESSVAALSLSRSRTDAIEQLDTIPPPLSPTIDELDTIPPQLSPAVAKRSVTLPQPTIDELDTTPQMSPSLDRQITVPPQMSPAIDELATQPPQAKERPTVQKDAGLFVQQHSPLASVSPATVESILQKKVAEGTPWTTAQGKDSWLAQRVLSKKGESKRKRFNPLDSLRWWLLYPGRIEFLLWLNGAVVLVVITFLLLFATTLSMGWLNIGGARNSSNGMQKAHASATQPAPAQTPCTAANANRPQCRSTTVSSSGLRLTLVDNNVLYANTPIYLHGQGFSVNGTIALTYDAQLPCHPNITQTDAQGNFSISLLLNSDVQAGKHQIVALDMASSHTVKVTVDIAASSTNTTFPSSNVQSPPSGNGQGKPRPIGQTPVPVAPTAATSPTAVPTQVASPTAGVSPTVGTTPTVSATTTPAIEQKSTGSYLALRDSLYNESADGHYFVNPWLWVAILGYMLSMSMLGCAGLLYRKKRRKA